MKSEGERRLCSWEVDLSELRNCPSVLNDNDGPDVFDEMKKIFFLGFVVADFYWFPESGFSPLVMDSVVCNRGVMLLDKDFCDLNS